MLFYSLVRKYGPVKPQVSDYPTGNKRLNLVTDIGVPFATATMDTSIKLKHNEVLIKDSDENQGIVDYLVSQGIVSPTGETVIQGACTAKLCILH
ncbi:MAG: hypothetical protein V3W04_06595 [Gammaproteobacteria bacterium]